MKHHLGFAFLTVSLVLVANGALAAKKTAQPHIGKADAPVGGTFYRFLDADPDSLNPNRSHDVYGSLIESFCFDSLLSRNIESYEFEPGLAESWSVAPDGKSFTFTIRKDAKFHNGEPVTVEDIKFSYEAVLDPKLADPTHRVYFENIEKAEILSPNQIKFYVKRKYFLNLDSLGEMAILPKSAYSNPEKRMAREIIGSGPYKLESYEIGKALTLVRNKEWWGFKTPEADGYNKFEKMVFKIVKDPNAQLETFKKGEVDYMGLTPEQFEKKTDGPEWGTRLTKRSVENSAGKGTAFIGFNLHKPMFQDRKVREALSLLFNRPFMIEKFLYGKALPATGPWYQQSPDADPKAKPYAYDPERAKQLLKEAGWADSDKDGVLDKVIDGQKTDFKFSVLIPSPEWEKFLTVFQQDLKKAGIDMQIKVEEWNSFEKAMDDGKFDTIALSWSSPVNSDPKQIWHSSSQGKGGSNFIGYSNPEVDKLIDKAREEMDSKRRRPLMQKVFSLIANDYPYVFFWNGKYAFYATDKKIQMVKPTYKYDIGIGTWWQGPE